MRRLFAEGRALGEEGRRIAETVAHPVRLMSGLLQGLACYSSAMATCPRRSPRSNAPWTSAKTSWAFALRWLRLWA